MKLLVRTVLAATLALGACVSAPPVRQTPAPSPPPPRPVLGQPAPQVAPPPSPPPVSGRLVPEIMQGRGLEGVIGEDGAGLLRRFGPPRLETFEGDMRKLQFAGEACVLDVFLYPLAPGAEPVATWIEARRRSDGAEVDRAACVAALSTRR